MKEQYEAISKVVEILKAGVQMASIDPISIAKGVYKFLSAARSLYNNYKKLEESFNKMKDGGLGIDSCDSMSEDIKRLNILLEKSHGNGVYDYGESRWISH